MPKTLFYLQLSKLPLVGKLSLRAQGMMKFCQPTRLSDLLITHVFTPCPAIPGGGVASPTVAAVTTTLVTTLAPTTTPVPTTVTTITTTVQRTSTIGTSFPECLNCFITNMNIFSCLSSCGASSRVVMCPHLPQCGSRIFPCQAPVRQIKSYKI